VPERDSSIAELPPDLSATQSALNRKRSPLSEENKMEDFPLWLKLFVWGTIGLTVGYALWGMFHSFFLS
jgi:hypothetical protein